MHDERPTTILVVEDYAPNRKIVELQLKGFPVVIEEAENGAQAVAKVAGKRYDLILMDLEMPVMDGLEATRRIREYERAYCLAPTAIVALTSHDTIQDRKDSLAAGCTAFLPKPVTRQAIADLLAILRGKPAEEPRDCIDPDLADLIPAFLEITGAEALDMKKCLEQGDFQTLARHGHSLKGAAANYGFPELGRLGGRIEAAALATPPPGDIEGLIEAVIERLGVLAASRKG
jgi:CheY-like chemotaxis protein